MAENIPPTSASKTPNASDRGIPYYEKLRRDLRDTINKKRLLDRNLSSVESEIYKLETAYLEETSSAGNIVKGFDNYIKAATAGATAAGSGTITGSQAGGARGRRGVANDADRIFSRSSVSFNRDADSPGLGSAVSTPGGGGTPAASVAGDGGGREKKKKKSTAAAHADEDDTRSTKRQKITFGSRKD